MYNFNNIIMSVFGICIYVLHNVSLMKDQALLISPLQNVVSKPHTSFRRLFPKCPPMETGLGTYPFSKTTSTFAMAPLSLLNGSPPLHPASKANQKLNGQPDLLPSALPVLPRGNKKEES